MKQDFSCALLEFPWWTPISKNPDILPKSRRSLLQVYIYSGWGSICAHDDMMIYSWLSCSNLKARGKSFIYRKQLNANQNQSNANRNQSNANRNQSNANRNQSNQSRKTLENLIGSITVRLIRSSHDDNDIQLTRSFKSQGKGKSFILFIETNRTVIESNRTFNRNQSNQSRKTLENLIDSITVRLIWSIENQSNDWIRLISLNSIANRRSIAFDWLRLVYLGVTSPNGRVVSRFFKLEQIVLF